MVQIWRRSKKCHQKTIIGDNNTAPQLKDLMGREISEKKNCLRMFKTLTITIDIDIGIDSGIHSQKSLPLAIVAAFI